MTELCVLVTAEDSGPVPFSAKNYRLGYLKTRELWLRDFFHAAWRSILNAAGDARLKGVIYVTGLGQKLSRGPWNSGGWLEEIGSAAKELVSVGGGRRSELLRAQADRILRDLGRGNETVTDEILEELCGLIMEEDFLSGHGPDFHLTRWLSWLDGELYWSPRAGMRHVILEYLGVESRKQMEDPRNKLTKLLEKHVDQNRAAEQAGQSSASGAHTSGRINVPMSAPTQKSVTPLLRQNCQNTIEVATLIWSDERYSGWAKILRYPAEPFADVVRHYRHFVRDRENNQLYHFEMARGTRIIQAIHESFNVLMDMSKMEGMGFVVEKLTSHVRFRDMKVEDGFILEQDEQADKLGVYLESLARQFVVNFSDAGCCFPRRFLLCASGNPDRGEVKEVYKEFLTAVRAHESLMKKTLTAWRARKLRSSMNETLVQDWAIRCMRQPVEYLEPPPDIAEHLDQVSKLFPNTGVTEDSFHYRKGAQRAAEPGKLSASKMWEVCSRKRILSRLYKFREVGTANRLDPDLRFDDSDSDGYDSDSDNDEEEPQVRKPAAKRRREESQAGEPVAKKRRSTEEPTPTAEPLPRNFYHPVTALMSDPRIKEITKKGSKGDPAPKYPKFWPPHKFHKVAEDQKLSVLMEKDQTWGEIGRIWRSVFAPRGLIVRTTKVPGRYFMSLGCEDEVLCLFPFERQLFGGTGVSLAFFVPDTKVKKMSDLLFLPILDFKDWRVQPTQRVSPAHMFLLNKRRLLERWPSSNILAKGGETMVPKHAALSGFFHLKGGYVKKLAAQEKNEEFPDATTEEEILLRGIELFGPLSREAACDVLEARVGALRNAGSCEFEQESILGHPSAQEYISASDKNEVSQFRIDVQDKDSHCEALLRKVGRVRRGEAKDGGTVASGPTERSAFPSADEFTEAEAAGFFPAKSLVYKDTDYGRWRVWYGPTLPGCARWSVSSSWGASGKDSRCLRELIPLVWARHAKTHPGETCPIVFGNKDVVPLERTEGESLRRRKRRTGATDLERPEGAPTELRGPDTQRLPGAAR